MVGQEELISVVIPVYNVVNYLERCIQSILNQTYHNLDILLIDDGSTDGSGELCDQYAMQDRRISVYHGRNNGLSVARNRGIDMSRGYYISLIDSDDFVEKHFIELLYKAAIETGSDITCTKVLRTYDKGEKRLEKYWAKRNIRQSSYTVYSAEHILECSLYQTISITGAPLKLYKRKCFEKIRFPKGKYYEDLATTYQFFMQANQVAILDVELYAYRVRKTSILNGKFNEKNLDCLWVSQKLVQDIVSEIPLLKPAAYCAAFRINRIVFPKIPFSNIQKDEVWRKIKQYRRVVFKDKKAQKYERLLAGLSYGGPHFFMIILKLFEIACKVRNETELIRKKVSYVGKA